MSLSERVAAATHSLWGCRTCAFYEGLPVEDRTAFDEWVDSERPIEELRRLCVEEGLGVTETPFRTHIRDHHRGRS